MIFTIVKKTLGLRETGKPLKERQVELQNVLVWLIREQRLHDMDEEEIEINIKLDGRPFWGKKSKQMYLINYNHLSITAIIILNLHNYNK